MIFCRHIFCLGRLSSNLSPQCSVISLKVAHLLPKSSDLGLEPSDCALKDRDSPSHLPEGLYF